MNSRADNTLYANSMDALPNAVALLHDMERSLVRMAHAHITLVLFVLSETTSATQRTSQQAAFIRALRAHTLPCDGIGILQAYYALVLPGARLPEALTLTETILNTYTQPCISGIATRNGHDRAPRLVREALEAVAHARASGLRLYAHKAESDALRKTLVLTDEKRFLFSCGD